MKTNQNFRHSYSQKQKNSSTETIVLSGLTIVIFGYIVLQFIYPLIVQGLLF